MSGVFTCNLDGYTTMVDTIMSLAFLAITVNASLIELVLGVFPDLAISFAALMRLLRSANNWIGFLIGAIYYFGLEFGYGDLLCELSGYGY